ncbi:MAG: DUF4440 domain-containing protein [Terracidiphilus sp.]
MTDPEMAGVLEELKAREPIFHRPEFGVSRADFERMTAPDFWETGASGRRYTRSQVLDVVTARWADPQPEVWETSGFHLRRLSPDTYLLTYTLLQEHTRLTRRMTLWRATPEGWRILYHQGTLVEQA